MIFLVTLIYLALFSIGQMVILNLKDLLNKSEGFYKTLSLVNVVVVAVPFLLVVLRAVLRDGIFTIYNFINILNVAFGMFYLFTIFSLVLFIAIKSRQSWSRKTSERIRHHAA